MKQIQINSRPSEQKCGRPIFIWTNGSESEISASKGLCYAESANFFLKCLSCAFSSVKFLFNAKRQRILKNYIHLTFFSPGFEVLTYLIAMAVNENLWHWTRERIFITQMQIYRKREIHFFGIRHLNAF